MKSNVSFQDERSLSSSVPGDSGSCQTRATFSAQIQAARINSSLTGCSDSGLIVSRRSAIRWSSSDGGGDSTPSGFDLDCACVSAADLFRFFRFFRTLADRLNHGGREKANSG